MRRRTRHRTACGQSYDIQGRKGNRGENEIYPHADEDNTNGGCPVGMVAAEFSDQHHTFLGDGDSGILDYGKSDDESAKMQLIPLMSSHLRASSARPIIFSLCTKWKQKIMCVPIATLIALLNFPKIPLWNPIFFCNDLESFEIVCQVEDGVG